MKPHFEAPRAWRLALLGTAALLTVTSAVAQTPAPAGRYPQEVQACLLGVTPQDQARCLRDAEAARVQRHRPAGAASDPLLGNAMARCAPLRGEDRHACRARVLGYGSSSGSVAGGGMLYEMETAVIPAGVDAILVEPGASGRVWVAPAGR